MRIKTFFTAYLTFLFILFMTISAISVYMTNTQMNMVKERSLREYHTISTSLMRDLMGLLERSDENFLQARAIKSLVNSYADFYREHDINLSLTSLLTESDFNLSLTEEDQRHYVRISAELPSPFQNYRLEAYFDITENLLSIKNIQQVLLILFVLVSIFAAFALYVLLKKIFEPLEVVAIASKKIAGGEYNERIFIKGENEISAMAADFNKMAEEIEVQIKVLEGEALGKQQFVDSFAHEIRTPLTTIYGYAEYMQKARVEEEELIEVSQYIMDEANHMKKIANSLLELATLRNFRPKKERIHLPNLLEEVKQILSPPLIEKKVALECQTNITFFEAQEDLMRSLLLNLCFNALKACTYGKGTIYLSIIEEEGEVTLLVNDNGCGIPKESIGKVIEPFYRVDKVRNRDLGGTGLGLTLCHQIARLHHGQLSIESKEGVGTTVKIIFTSS